MILPIPLYAAIMCFLLVSAAVLLTMAALQATRVNEKREDWVRGQLRGDRRIERLR